MTTKERLAMMEEIKRKNDAAWSKYARQSRPGWTWDMEAQRRLNPFDSLGFKITLLICFPALLVLFVLLA